MARSAPPSWTLFESDGVRRGASKLHGVGTFARRDLAAGELLLVEAGLCAPRGFGALLMTAVLHSAQNAAALLPRSSHATDGIIEMLHPFALRYKGEMFA